MFAQIATIPESIFGFLHLEVLDISHNRLHRYRYHLHSKQCCRSKNFWISVRIRIRILLFSSVTFKTSTKNFVSLTFLLFGLLFFLKVLLHHFPKIKSHKEVTKQQESMFFFLFLLGDRRFRIHISDLQIRLRIRDAQKHMDPTVPDPQH